MEKLSLRIRDVSFVFLALMIPFSIAGATGAIFLGIIGWLFAISSSPQARASFGRMRKDPFTWVCILLILTAIPSVLMSENRNRAFYDWKSYWLFAVYFLVAYNLSSEKFRKGLFWTLFGSMMLCCAVALVQHFGGLDLFLFTIQPKHRPGGTLYSITLAGILYQTILLASSVLTKERKLTLTTFLLGAGILIQTTVLLFTLTRGAYVALAGGLFVAVMISRSRVALIQTAVLIGLLALFLSRHPTDLDRSLSVPNLVNTPPDRNVYTRLVLWDISLDLFKRHPVFGVGMGDYSIEAEKLLRERNVTTTVDSHNIYLQILTTRGLFGFIPFVLFWVVLLRELFRLKNRFLKGSFERCLAVGAIAATAAVLFGALTENNIDDSEVFIAYLFIIGLTRSVTLSLRHYPR